MNILRKAYSSAKLRGIKSKANKLRQELKALSRKRKAALKEEIRKISKKVRSTKRKPVKRKTRRY